MDRDQRACHSRFSIFEQKDRVHAPTRLHAQFGMQERVRSTTRGMEGWRGTSCLQQGGKRGELADGPVPSSRDQRIHPQRGSFGGGGEGGGSLTFTLPESCPAALSHSGASFWQCPHQGAKNSTSHISSESSTISLKLFSFSSTTGPLPPEAFFFGLSSLVWSGGGEKNMRFNTRHETEGGGSMVTLASGGLSPVL